MSFGETPTEWALLTFFADSSVSSLHAGHTQSPILHIFSGSDQNQPFSTAQHGNTRGGGGGREGLTLNTNLVSEQAHTATSDHDRPHRLARVELSSHATSTSSVLSLP